MKNALRDQVGALLVFELLILAAVLIVAVFAGYQYEKNVKTVSKATTPKPHVIAKASTSPSATPIASEFDIPELGIKMTLPSGLSGLTYTAQVNAHGTANQPYTYSVAYLSTTAISTAGGDQYCGASSGPIGAISEFQVDPGTLGVGGITPGAAKKIGNQYVLYEGPQASCSDSINVKNLENSTIKLMEQAFSTATPLN